MEFLQSLLENSELPFLTAFILGIMTAISPCPLATNISAIAYISKEIDNRRMVFVNGLIYTLGRAVSYGLLGLIFYFGASQFKIATFFQDWGERLLGPLLLIIGFLMFDFISIKFPGLGKLTDRFEKKAKSGPWGAFMLGIVFALAFCPYSGVMFFGMLIPITISSASGLYLPLIFAFATGLPVIVFAWIIAFTVGSVGGLYNRVKIFEYWFRRVVAIVFMAVGIYYIAIFYF